VATKWTEIEETFVTEGWSKVSFASIAETLAEDACRPVSLAVRTRRGHHSPAAWADDIASVNVWRPAKENMPSWERGTTIVVVKDTAGRTVHKFSYSDGSTGWSPTNKSVLREIANSGSTAAATRKANEHSRQEAQNKKDADEERYEKLAQDATELMAGAGYETVVESDGGGMALISLEDLLSLLRTER
jgi:hypothetical protein